MKMHSPYGSSLLSMSSTLSEALAKTLRFCASRPLASLVSSDNALYLDARRRGSSSRPLAARLGFFAYRRLFDKPIQVHFARMVPAHVPDDLLLDKLDFTVRLRPGSYMVRPHMAACFGRTTQGSVRLRVADQLFDIKKVWHG